MLGRNPKEKDNYKDILEVFLKPPEPPQDSDF
jgi:hypothetical protein